MNWCPGSVTLRLCHQSAPPTRTLYSNSPPMAGIVVVPLSECHVLFLPGWIDGIDGTHLSIQCQPDWRKLAGGSSAKNTRNWPVPETSDRGSRGFG